MSKDIIKNLTPEPADQQPTALEQRSRELFDDRVASLDAHTRSRLNQARQAALDAARGHSRPIILRWLAPAGSVAALALVALVSLQFIHGGDITASTPMEDMEIIASSDELDLMQNVEFYDWLDSVDTPADNEDG